jgi:hypothetical protein
MGLHDTLYFVACRDCNELRPVIDHSLAHSDAAEAESLNAYDEFLARHHAHHIACLWRSGSELHADRALWDPMATLTFEVTDGDQSYVVSATRRSIDDEREYRFTTGVLEVGNSEVHIDPSDLRRGLDRQFYPHALRPTKLDRFLSAVHEVITHIDANELAIAFDAADDPAVSIACMPEDTFNELLARCTDIFDPWELSHVLDFLRANRDADGLLALRVRRHVAALSA